LAQAGHYPTDTVLRKYCRYFAFEGAPDRRCYVQVFCFQSAFISISNM